MADKIRYRVILDNPFAKRKIVSYGLIVVAKSTGRSIVVQRKHSVEFLAILGGCFRTGLLPFLMSEITKSEQWLLKLLLQLGEKYFRRLYHELNLFPAGYGYAWKAWNHNYKRIAHLLENLKQNKELTWTWPKGRLSQETGYDCAHREFMEEVQVKLPPSIYRSKEPIILNLTTMCNREIESRYWLYVIDNEIELPIAVNHPEVEDRKWVSLDECRVMVGVVPKELEDIIKKMI